MSATNLALAVRAPSKQLQPAEHVSATTGPALCCKPLLRPELPRRFIRVPTHAVGAHPEHREYPRACLQLPLKLHSINGIVEDFPITLVTRDISSTGVYFLCPKQLPMNSAIELQIVLVSRPLGQGNVVMTSNAYVRRIHPAAMPGWFGIAANFEDVSFDRDDFIPSRFLGT